MNKDNKKIWKVGTFNIQAGLSTNSYKEYITKSWHHIFPNTTLKNKNIIEISQKIKEFDVLGIQEIDTGSIRSGFVNQADLMAKHSQLNNYTYHVNRDTGMSITANALFSKLPLSHIEYWQLPTSRSHFSSRGAILALIDNQWWCCVAHLSLHKKSRLYQASFLSERLENKKNIVLLGDFNDEYSSKSLAPLKRSFQSNSSGLSKCPTYPRWSPCKNIDLMWWKNIKVLEQTVYPWGYSDHCCFGMLFHL